jgi:hypothetical protein
MAATSGVSQAKPDYPRLIATNLPATFGLLALAAIGDVAFGGQVSRFVLRYGGPGAPLVSVVPFWLLSVVGLGFTSTLLTTLMLPESFILKGECPECGEPSQAFFGDVFGVKGDGASRVVTCKNCMADMEFELGSREIWLLRTAAEKTSEALERGRKRAIKDARRAAQDDV